MNKHEYEMVDTLKRLKNDFGVFEIKAEFENEGSRMVELMRLKDVASQAGLPIILKIGGVEAVSNMYEALSIGAKGIVAPMTETAFSTKKFVDAIETFIPEDNRKDIEFAINVETITAHNNFDEMLELEKIKLLSSITVGRVDFTGSLGVGRDKIDSDEVSNYCKNIFEKSKAKGLKTALGGGISLNSVDFITQLVKENLLDKFETRKIVFNKDAIKTIEKGLPEAIKFELQWLKSKRRYYHLITQEDEKRIEMIERRLNG